MNDITRFNKLISLQGRGEYKIESLAKIKDDIRFLCDFHTKSTAATAFCVGGMLSEMKAQLDHGKFLKYLEKEFAYSRKTAGQYMRLYERFKDNPDELENFGLREALIWAGIIKPKERKIIPYLPEEHYGDRLKESDLSAFFAAPPLNVSAKLEKYRFRANYGRIEIIEKGYNEPFPVVSIQAIGEADVRLNTDYRNLMRNIQCLLEKYYERVEYIQQEDQKMLKSMGLATAKKIKSYTFVDGINNNPKKKR